jgi:hypothetical protein
MASQYAWLIDESSLDGDKPFKPVIGPRGANDELLARLRAGEGEPFRIYDDDEEEYYRGRIIGDYSGFEPLDDYGMPNAGATEIRYRSQSGAWEIL